MFKGIVFKPKEEEEYFCMKFKVKCLGQYPTKLHSLEQNGSVVRKGGSKLEFLRPPSEVAPILTVLSIWFMSGGSFGVSLQAEEIVVKNVAARPSVGVRLASGVRVVEESEAAVEADEGILLDGEEEESVPKRHKPEGGAGGSAEVDGW